MYNYFVTLFDSQEKTWEPIARETALGIMASLGKEYARKMLGEMEESGEEYTCGKYVLKAVPVDGAAMESVSINDTDKIASTIAGTYFHDNDYHDCIKKTARILVDAGLGHYRYHTQFGSGCCVYRSPDDSEAVTVDPDSGTIS